MKSKGFTLPDVLLVIAIAALLFMLSAGIFQRVAGAHEIKHSALTSYLAGIGADYRWGENSHTLIIINRGAAEWGSVRDACFALTAHDRTLSGMQLILQDGTSGTAEIWWEDFGDTRIFTNLLSTDTAIC